MDIRKIEEQVLEELKETDPENKVTNIFEKSNKARELAKDIAIELKEKHDKEKEQGHYNKIRKAMGLK